jgi:hypothetical protein
MKYFKECKTVEEIKKTFRKMALEHHPDRGGNLEKMQEINNQYSFAIASVLNGSKFQDDEMEIAEDFKKIIDALINLENLIILIVGNWIWVSGETKKHKEIIKSLGMFWANKKKMWYYRPKNFKGGNGKKSFSEIVGKYGSKTVKSKQTTGTRILKTS